MSFDLIRAGIDRCRIIEGEDPPPSYKDLIGEELDVDELAALYLAGKEMSRLLNKVVAAIGDELSPILESDGAVQVGDTLVWYGEKTVEKCIDHRAFTEYLAVHPDLIHKVFNPDYARKGSLPPEVRDTFFFKEKRGKAEISDAPVEVIEANRQRRNRD